jgi:hypothetical protein
MAKPYDAGFLTAALAGYQSQLEEIQGKIAELRKRLGQRAPAAPGAARAKPKTPHVISPEGRARIAAAQRRRWAAAKKGAKVKTAGAE